MKAVIRSEETRLRAFHDADKEAFARLVTEDLVMTHGGGEVFDKTQEMALMRPGTPERPLPTLTVEKPDVRIYGKAAVMAGNLVETAADGRRELVMRFTNVYRLQGGQWRLAAGQLTTLSRQRPVATVSPATLATYVGHYRSPAGRLLEISTAQSKPYVAIGGERLELIPVSESQFAIGEADVLLAFIKDRAGKVIGLINRRPNGDVIQEEKVD
jgi:hypothetical protein